MKTLRGCIRESRYIVDETLDRMIPEKTRFYTEGQVSWMSDDLGLHKIGNPAASGSVSLHLYTPPFSSCRVWNDESTSLNGFEMSKVGFFSVLGLRTPQLEGRPGHQAMMIQELHGIFDGERSSSDSSGDEGDGHQESWVEKCLILPSSFIARRLAARQSCSIEQEFIRDL